MKKKKWKKPLKLVVEKERKLRLLFLSKYNNKRNLFVNTKKEKTEPDDSKTHVEVSLYNWVIELSFFLFCSKKWVLWVFLNAS